LAPCLIISEGAYADKLLVEGNSLDLTKPLQRIAFGSCVKQFEAQPIWDAKPSPEILMVAMDENGEVIFDYTLSLGELN